VFFKNYTYSLYLVEGLAWWDGPLPGALTKCYPSVLDTVGWVIWPVKIVPDMTYNVFGWTLNPTLLCYLLTYSVTQNADAVLTSRGKFKCGE